MPTSYTSSVLPPHERGVELGQRFAAEIAETVARYRRLFERRAEGPFDVDLWSSRAWRSIQALAPQHADEIAGIADGAGMTAERVASVNARTEILVAANPSGQTECSAVVSLPPGRPPVAVQTWDWYDAMRDNWLHWHIPRPDGRVVETVTEFGMLAKIGVSRTGDGRGIGVLLNMLHHQSDGAEEIGHPVHLLSRQILDQAGDLDEALVIAKAANPSASTSLTLVDPSGRAVSVELSPGGPGLLEPGDGVVVRTNHFITPDRESGCLADRIGPSSRIRRRTLLDAFGTTRPRSAVDVIEAMHDHRDVGGVCAHPDQSMDPVLWHATLATVSLDLSSGTLDVTPGGPCAR